MVVAWQEQSTERATQEQEHEIIVTGGRAGEGGVYLKPIAVLDSAKEAPKL